MPVPVRDTPLGRELYQEGRDDGRSEGRNEGRNEGRQEGRREGRQEGEHQAALRFTRLMLRQRFGDDFPALASIELPDTPARKAVLLDLPAWLAVARRV